MCRIMRKRFGSPRSFLRLTLRKVVCQSESTKAICRSTSASVLAVRNDHSFCASSLWSNFSFVSHLLGEIDLVQATVSKIKTGENVMFICQSQTKMFIYRTIIEFNLQLWIEVLVNRRLMLLDFLIIYELA